MITRCLPVLMLLFLSPVYAGLIGADVTGTYLSNGNPFLGPVSKTIGPDVEFRFSAMGDTMDSDFSATGLSVRFYGATDVTVPLLVARFTSAKPGLFLGVAELTDTFPGGSAIVLNGDTLTWTWLGSRDFLRPDYSATFAINSGPDVPEPGTVLLVVLGMGGAILRRAVPTNR